jgi:peptide-methionine (S)-S-oxide reductase
MPPCTSPLALAATIALASLAASPIPTARAGDPAVAIVAGGCFWCVESDFDKVPGVISTVSGYTGGHKDNPTYEDVGSETSGHREAVQITFDPAVLPYEELIDIFWHSVDPTDAGGQFCDRGESYTTAIFVADEAQRDIAEASRVALDASGVLPGPVETPILPAGTFYPAEDYHQDYHHKNPLKYSYYRWSCGRDARIGALWGKDAHRGIPTS